MPISMIRLWEDGSCTPEELDESFTGIVLTFQPGERFEKQKKTDTWKSFIGQRLEGQYGALGKLLAVGLLLSFPGILIPVLSQVFLDEILIAEIKAGLQSFFYLWRQQCLCRSAFSYRDRLLARLQKKMVLLLRIRFSEECSVCPSAFSISGMWVIFPAVRLIMPVSVIFLQEIWRRRS